MEEPHSGDKPDGLKAYRPPEGPQSIHNVGYEFFERVGVHRIGNVALYGPKELILTADEDTQSEIERRGLEELPEESAQDALSAYRDGNDERVVEIAAEYRSDSAEQDETESGSEVEALRGSVEDLRERLSTGEYGPSPRRVGSRRECGRESEDGHRGDSAPTR